MTILALWDIESNGLLVPKMDKGVLTPPMDRVHCIAILFRNLETGAERYVSAADQPGYEKGTSGRGWERMPILDALKLLEQADIRVGHNSQDFDERAIRKIYPWFSPKEGSRVVDTLILSRLIYPDIAKSGPNGHLLMGNMKVRHSLECWGRRLGEHKGDYKGGWAQWSEEMQDYMEQDVKVLAKLFRWLNAQKPTPESVALEHDFAQVIRRQETRGFAFNYDKALDLLATLQAHSTNLEAALIEAFGEWWVYGKAASAGASRPESFAPDDDDLADDPEEQERRRQMWLTRQKFGEVTIPTKSRNVKMLGFPDVTRPRFSDKTGKEITPYVGPPLASYVQGAAYTPIKRVQFNPSSRAHIRQRLIVKYGWEPVKFTKGSKTSPPVPVVDDDVLRALPYPEAQQLADYYLVLKRLGQLAVGKKAWLKVARETEMPNGKSVWRIHGRVNTNGAVTGRCTHSDPNVAQVPKNTAGSEAVARTGWEELSGAACRDLFIPGPGYSLIGFDGASLELRMLAHYVAEWDKGEYAEIIEKGVKEEGTDPHSWLRDLVGTNLLGSGNLGRDNAKTTMYAFVYGAGNEKLGSIVMPLGTLHEKREVGAEVKAKVMGAFSAMGNLQTAIVQEVEAKGFLTGLDGRVLRVRKAHAALNTLLQSAGAIVMKKGLVLLDRSLARNGVRFGHDYEFVANIHDEAQAEVLPQFTPQFSELVPPAFLSAGDALRVRCPIRAEVSIGTSWKETH